MTLHQPAVLLHHFKDELSGLRRSTLPGQPQHLRPEVVQKKTFWDHSLVFDTLSRQLLPTPSGRVSVLSRSGVDGDIL